jgi:uncharacterized protein
LNDQNHNNNEIMTPSDIREAAEDVGSNPSANETMGDIIQRRYSRRGILSGSLAVTAIASTVSPMALLCASPARADASAFGFTELQAGVDESHHVADGYDVQVLLRWGDKIFTDSPEFDVMNQSAEAQLRQFGYNNDYIGYYPIDGADDHGLLFVNHEYVNPELIFPNWATIGKDEKGKDQVKMGEYSKELVDIEMAAHGGTIVEIRKVEGKWEPVLDGAFNRRITATTEIELTGPVAGTPRVTTVADPTGRKVFGTFNNCAGGVTPWGTYLMSEENINNYFLGELPEGHGEAQNYKRMGIPRGSYEWGKFHDRFDISKDPNEANRFGWVVEVDPSDPNSVPKKRTAIGRYKHEGCENIVNGDGRIVLYSGDDERFEYVYKFVTAGTYDAIDRSANLDLLAEGTLYVARFNADGTVDWLPLVHGTGSLTAENGFASQADVLVETRRAADLVGATKMDRPEDIQPNPGTGKVYVMLTNNTKRKEGQEDAANPRANNAFGHIIEITEQGGNFASEHSTWEILLKCGDPSVAEVGATFSSATTANGWFGMPDNCAIDSEGRLWVATDGNNEKATGRADGIWAVDTEGEARGTSKLFFRVPRGAEMCGPNFTPGSENMFLSVQHPGDEGLATFENPATRWPDFQDGTPPRPSVVIITKQGGGKIGL